MRKGDEAYFYYTLLMKRFIRRGESVREVIELLVVVARVAIPAAILFPVSAYDAALDTLPCGAKETGKLHSLKR